MRKRAPFYTAIALAVMGWPVFAAATIPFAEISTALAAGDGAGALRLVDPVIGQPGLNDADRARLTADRGFARNLEGDRDGAMADLTQAIDTRALPAQEQARLYLERGLILDALNHFNDAVGDYGAALRLVPNSAPALNNRANVFRRQNRFEDARRDYLASLAADNPAPEYPYFGLGQIAESQGKSEEARNFYARAVAANPGYALAANRLAALGGAPALAPITLKPPKSQVAEIPSVVLHQPAARPAAAGFVAPPPTIKPARYSDRDSQPGLRPALDNPGAGDTPGDNPGSELIQLGAWRLESEAAEGWNHAVKAAGGVLSGFAPHIVAVDLPGKGRYYRLRVATPDGKQLCSALAARGLDCILARQ